MKTTMMKANMTTFEKFTYQAPTAEVLEVSAGQHILNGSATIDNFGAEELYDPFYTL